MRLASFLDGAGPAIGLVFEGGLVPARSLIEAAPASIAELVASPDRLAALRRAADSGVDGVARRPLDKVTLLPPVATPSKIIAIGQNYPEHAREGGAEVPAAPLVFAKLPSAIVGHGAAIEWDGAKVRQVDYEAELAVVIGRTARNVSRAEAMDYVLGFTCLNDVSARDLQFGDGQWVRGKSLDTFCPMGPLLVTPDELDDPHRLGIRCFVNGECVQDGTTSEMFFDVPDIVSFCSTWFTLHPGDVIATGTPPGVGAFRDPPRFLQNGDIVEVEIEGVGRLVNVCRASAAEIPA